MRFNVILFEGFETLDVFGPVEVFGTLEQYYQIEFYSEHGGIIRSHQNVRVETMPISEISSPDVILIPGGNGTRREVTNEPFLAALKELCEKAGYVLTVCTGTSLLARTGLLDGRKATSNKMAFDWVVTQGEKVEWVRKARWVKDGKFYTSSGVSAGIDMALGFVADTLRPEASGKIAHAIEYVWNKDPDNDPFC